ncbi:PLP-dependent aminotransferase family protein [Staphylococcus xylosus]|uniref:aminotransferase-like domain-containing protein n=1 Tax=Staphylococcus xylosus TaxID=1288 RepID=UPI0015597876|nr:PLP-dependent aminotransferase family protein [Staphylococcus xylosus]NQD99297.1 PLP-dependent aminotransferase family protein [Staphylococcus xylosus]
MFKPKYKKIIDNIILQIDTGELEPGMQLPSQRDMARKYQVNRSTVIQAIDILKSQGIIKGREKQRLYVSGNTWHTYIRNNINWQNYISNSTTKNNQYFVQQINKLEFHSNMMRLSTGELAPNLIPNEQFKEILSKCNTNVLNTNYEPPQGNIKLREAVVQYMQKLGITCTVDHICITSGALQGLKLIADGLLIPQSKIIVESPSYINSIRTWHNIRADIQKLSISDIKSNINNIFKAQAQYANSIFYCIPTLHNPTQHCYSIEEKQKIMMQCEQHGMPIVEDDVYGDLYFNGERPKPLKSFDTNDNILYLNSLSKTVSPGLRVGWIVAKPSVVAHLADLKMQNDYGASSISQYIATEWLTQTHYHDQHLKGLKDKLLIKRNLFLESLNKYFSNLGSWSTPEGSFYIWFQFKYSIDMKKLFDAAIAENILINPGEVYDKHAHHCIRFSYAYIDADDIDVALKRLSEIIQTRFTTSS